MRIEKEFEVCAGHRLMHHKGGCYNPHGHNFKIVLVLDEPNELPKNGMVMDYKLVRNIAEPILDLMDHAMILNPQDTVMVEFCNLHGFKKLVLGEEPTSEHIAIWLYNALELPFEGLLVEVRVHETPSTVAVYKK